ncbi:hypothetical protein RF11_16465 [Thelohanellus kitauei]|uniref:Integrase catalytic domain-containing protein n=1 Tax=Thelohanellus kitauei TaxID=669202 RepID=A0A0C2JH95_THEKT|nr:hypothetical protein RF11_16465 [Thelohanellus kitauei]
MHYLNVNPVIVTSQKIIPQKISSGRLEKKPLYWPTTYDGERFRHIMVYVDHFSKWVEATAIPDISAETTANVVFTNIISRYGILNVILTDQGTAFESSFSLIFVGSWESKNFALHPIIQRQMA